MYVHFYEIVGKIGPWRTIGAAKAAFPFSILLLLNDMVYVELNNDVGSGIDERYEMN